MKIYFKFACSQRMYIFFKRRKILEEKKPHKYVYLAICFTYTWSNFLKRSNNASLPNEMKRILKFL